MARGGNVRVRFSADTTDLARGSQAAGRDLERFERRGSKALAGIKKSATVAGAALAGGLVLGGKEAAEAAIESEKSAARLKAQLDAVGESYDKHAGKIDAVIQKHSQLAGLDDEDLQDAFTNLLRVTKDVDGALELLGTTSDFARAKNMDVAKAGELVGKVAGGNTGILSRYGIEIEKGATAQEALAELQERFAGQAEAYGKTTQGSLDRASVASENLGEIVGAKLTPLLATGATALVNLIDKSGQLAGPIKTATGAVRNAYDSVREAVSKFVARNRDDIDSVIDAARNLGRFFKMIFEDVIVPTVRAVLPHIKRALEGIIQVIRGLVRIVTGIINGDWSKAWDGLKDVVSGAFKALRGVIGGAWELLKGVVVRLGGKIVAGLGDALSGLAGAIKDAVVSGVRKGVDAAKNAVGDIIGFLNPFGDGIGRLATGVGDGVGRSFAAPGGVNLMGADPDLYPFVAAGARAGLHTTSGIRPGSVTTSGNRSYHDSGDAVDMAGPLGAMRSFATSMFRRAGSRLRELISPWPELGIKDGRPYRYSSQIQAEHSGSNAHVHLAFTGPFGDGIGEAAQAAHRAGFRGQDLITAVAIAGPESSYRNRARLVTGAEDSRGFWQINTLAHPWARGWNLYDAFVNARAAHRVWRQAGGFRPWTAFTSGTYRAWLDRARAAVSGLAGRSRSRAGVGGGGGGRGTAGATGPNTAAGVGNTSAGGGGGGLGFEGQLARNDVAQAQAERDDNLPRLLKALKGERTIQRRRLKRVNKLLANPRLKKAARTALLQEKAQLIRDIGDLNDTIAEYQADRAGGATTITRADELDAGVDTNADTGGGSGGGASTPESDPNVARLADAIEESNRLTARLALLTERQGPQLLAGVIAAVNGGIGGGLGLGGFQAVGIPGQVARS